MARLIQKSGYIKNGKASGYMEYVATRDGVEIIQSTEPVTKKQEQFIKRLLKDFPDAKELFEYSDYEQTPNRCTASAFIVTALDTHLHEVESESGYMSYIAQRPRAEKHGGHGLFCEADTTDLKAAKAELDAHDGKVWTFIFSLRREDAERLGYNKAAAWQNLLKQESAAIAEAMRIRTDDFRWYAAYHDEGHHPHVHMMVWSAEPKKGYLTREGIAAMRSKMTNAIFHEEMKELYIKKDAAYKESIQTAKESLLLYIRMLENSESADPVIEQKLCDLSHALEQVDGKHVYGYLPKEVKAQVDEIVERGTAMTAVGSNPAFARAAGINVDKMRLISVIMSTWLGAVGILVYEQGFGFIQLYNGPFWMAMPAVAAILIGGASVNKASIGNVIIGTILYQGVVTMTPTVMNGLFHMDMSEVIRIIVSNGMIVYALTRKTEGGKN